MKWSFNKVREALENIHSRLLSEDNQQYSAYYVGGTLCIDFQHYPSVMLTRSGRGSFYSFKDKEYSMKNIKFVMDNKMRSLVRQIYKECKG